jgi:hypothetical protein
MKNETSITKSFAGFDENHSIPPVGGYLAYELLNILL